MSAPLLAFTEASRIIAWRNGSAVTTADFMADVYHLLPLLPDAVHILNDCHDRYRFAVALCAIMVAGKINLLPSTRTPQTIVQLQKFAADAWCITDQTPCGIALPQMQYPGLPEAHATTAPFFIPQLDASQTVAYVFTSGSTGTPIAHRKTWGALQRDVQTEARQLGLVAGDAYTLIGTVPAQHMYGFESTVLMALANGFALSNAPCFYPADICAAVQQVPLPRVLVTTPIHLRQLLAMERPLPAVTLLLSATAPLSPQLARQAEQAFGAPLMEIYGSTETGQFATRRPVQSQEWTLFPDVVMQRNSTDPQDERMWISGGHVEKPMPMNDVIECTEGNRFLLHGRMADMVNIAGKRSSLNWLNHQLNDIEGVADGAFFMPPENNTNVVTRLQAFVVAPTMNVADIMAALRTHIDPAFMPRPLHKVEHLPRNATGKLPQEVLAQLAQQLAESP